MGKIPDVLRETIARNIRDCRDNKFPGRGGGKKCAEAFGVSPQQWSPWERGIRTPDEWRLGKIADFFGVTVEWLRRDNRQSPLAQPGGPSSSDVSHAPPPLGAGQAPPNAGPSLGGIAGVDVPPPPSLWEPAPPGSVASFFWLARYFVDSIMRDGLTVRIDRHTAHFLASLFSQK